MLESRVHFLYLAVVSHTHKFLISTAFRMFMEWKCVFEREVLHLLQHCVGPSTSPMRHVVMTPMPTNLGRETQHQVSSVTCVAAFWSILVLLETQFMQPEAATVATAATEAAQQTKKKKKRTSCKIRSWNLGTSGCRESPWRGAREADEDRQRGGRRMSSKCLRRRVKVTGMLGDW